MAVKCDYCTEKCPQEELARKIAEDRMCATNEVIRLQKELEAIRAKTIDEFVERLMNEQIIGCMLPDGFRADVVTSHTVDTIAKQMKKEGAV